MSKCGGKGCGAKMEMPTTYHLATASLSLLVLDTAPRSSRYKHFTPLVESSRLIRLVQDDLRLFMIEACMLLLLHPLRSCGGLVSIVAPPYTPSSKLILARKAYHPRPSTPVSARSFGPWSYKSPAMSSSTATNLPRGAWDSHVHVVDEVSNVVWAVLLSDGHLPRKPSPSHKIMHSGRRKHLLRTCCSSRSSWVPIISAL